MDVGEETRQHLVASLRKALEEKMEEWEDSSLNLLAKAVTLMFLLEYMSREGNLVALQREGNEDNGESESG